MKQLLLCALAILFFLSGCTSKQITTNNEARSRQSSKISDGKNSRKNIRKTRDVASSEIWSKKNLYNPVTKSFFIPFELWAGEAWDGRKFFSFRAVNKKFSKKKFIRGPVVWKNPRTNEELKVYERRSGLKLQRFVMSANCIKRVFDSRKERYFLNGCKFPAGDGWKIGQKIKFEQTYWENGEVKKRLQEIEIEKMKFDINDVLLRMTYTYSVNGKLDHRYTYAPNKGLISLKKF